MAEDRDEASQAQGPAKLMKRARELASARAASSSNAPHRVMPRDVLQDGGPPPRDPDNAPQPRPRSDAPHFSGPPNDEEPPDVTEVRLPPNPVTGRPAGTGLDVVPIGAPTVPVPTPSDEATQVHIDPDLTVVRVPKPPPDPPAQPTPAPAPEAEIQPEQMKAEPGGPRLATPEDLGLSSANLEQEPLLKWIAIGLGLMLFVTAVFAVMAVIVVFLSS